MVGRGAASRCINAGSPRHLPLNLPLDTLAGASYSAPAGRAKCSKRRALIGGREGFEPGGSSSKMAESAGTRMALAGVSTTRDSGKASSLARDRNRSIDRNWSVVCASADNDYRLVAHRRIEWLKQTSPLYWIYCWRLAPDVASDLMGTFLAYPGRLTLGNGETLC
jgi:hypothetical protein